MAQYYVKVVRVYEDYIEAESEEDEEEEED